ncbi:uncharacterized protein LOC124887093 [Capsicum annuum]|uniref:uncharacterized protein LOC124887093 n=1 Tax=Capsicum annuum TaxID=4072 RepID=UPI001FB16005|nr:uncharacterized protein LOC124887093 [Capsicum annuum]
MTITKRSRLRLLRRIESNFDIENRVEANNRVDSDASRAQGAQPHVSEAQLAPSYRSCRFCGQQHRGQSKKGRNRYFICIQIWHMQRNCPSRVSFRENKVLIASSSAPTPNSATSSSGTGQNHLYALTTHRESVVSPDVVTVPKGATSSIGTGQNHLYALTVHQESEGSPNVVTDFEDIHVIVQELVKESFGVELLGLDGGAPYDSSQSVDQSGAKAPRFEVPPAPIVAHSRSTSGFPSCYVCW